MAKNDKSIDKPDPTPLEAEVASEAAQIATSAAASPSAPPIAKAVTNAVADIAAVVAQVPEEKISFDQWWMMITKKLKLKAHIKEILQAEFKARGLVKHELKQKFDEAMKLFGYKW